ncbi:unnamed protein product, partial [Polarella glacialis]
MESFFSSGRLSASGHSLAGIWAGLGALLCTSGGRFRYTVLFFPLLRISDAQDVEQLLAHLGRAVGAALASPPAPVHPALWHTAKVLAAEVLLRVLDVPLILNVATSGAVACTALWLADAPSSFTTVGELYPKWREYRMQALTALRHHAGAWAMAPLLWFGASMRSCQAAQLGGQELALVAVLGSRVALGCDWAVAVLANAALGVELLQRAGREAFGCSGTPGTSGTWSWRAWDLLCVAAGTWGATSQLLTLWTEAKSPGDQSLWLLITELP